VHVRNQSRPEPAPTAPSSSKPFRSRLREDRGTASPRPSMTSRAYSFSSCSIVTIPASFSRHSIPARCCSASLTHSSSLIFDNRCPRLCGRESPRGVRDQCDDGSCAGPLCRSGSADQDGRSPGAIARSTTIDNVIGDHEARPSCPASIARRRCSGRHGAPLRSQASVERRVGKVD
jgi:hypothetical protein